LLLRHWNALVLAFRPRRPLRIRIEKGERLNSIE